MAIRVHHQPAGAAVGMAAYAAGDGKAKQRKSKYAMDLWRDNQRHQFRMQERRALLGGRGAGGARGGGGVKGGGKWEDPFAVADPQGKVQINAQRKANARARRMGKAPPFPGAEPQFIPQDKIDADKQLADDVLKRKQELADEDRQRGFDVDDREDTQQHAEDMATDRALLDGTLVVSDDAKKQIKADVDDVIATMEKGGQLDDDEMAAERARLEEKRLKLRRAGAEKPPEVDALDAFNRTLVTMGPDGKFKAIGPGDTASHTLGEDGLQPIPQSTEQAEASAAKEADTKRRQAQIDSLNKRADAMRDKATDARTSTGAGKEPNEVDAATFERAEARLRREAEKLSGGEAGAPKAPATELNVGEDNKITLPGGEAPAEKQAAPVEQQAAPVEQQAVAAPSKAPYRPDDMRPDPATGKWAPAWKLGLAEPPPAAVAARPLPGGAPQIQTDADYERLPSGAVFIGPDGKRRRKP